MGRDQCDWSTEYRLFSRSPWHYRQRQKQRPTSQAARASIEEVRADLDRAGVIGRRLLVVLDGSFCNRVFMEKPIANVDLLCRARKDAVLCRRADPGQRGFYGK